MCNRRLLENEALPTNAREGHSPRRGAGSSARAAMDLPTARGASASGGGAPSEAQQDMWCHDCVGAFRLPASALSRDSDPTCSRCASTFVEAVEPPPGGGMHIELGADASPEDVVAAARQIVRRLAGTDGTHDAAASASTAATAETEIEIVAREAWSALLGAHGFPFRTQNGVSPFGLSPGGAASFQFGGSIPARAAGAPGVPTADAFFGGDVNIAELDTRTFFSPAHPDAVERLPRVTVAERGNRTGDGPGARGDDDDTGCPVCLTDMGHGPEGATLREMPCGHRFHDACLLEWLRTKNTCPVCRVALPSAPGGRP